MDRDDPPDRPVALTIARATICPPTGFFPDPGKPGRVAFDGGVYDSAGAIVALARHRLGGKANIGAARQSCVATQQLAGTWIYLGWLREHFGNFFEESLDRVWQVDRTSGPIEGVIYQLYHEEADWFGHAAAHAEIVATLPFVTEFLRLAGVTAPPVIACEPLGVERLIVPEAIGIDRRHGTPGAVAEQGALFARMAARVMLTSAPKRLYVSRARLPATLGKHLLEDMLEANLARQGYRVIHPETMTIDAQIAAYAGARKIVVAEGTPIHLIAAFAPPETKLAIIARRHPVPPRFLHQLRELRFARVTLIQERLGAVRAFAGDTPEVRADHPNDQFSHVALDLAAVGEVLAARGFVDRAGWAVPGAHDLDRAIDTAVAARAAAVPGPEYRYVAEPVSETQMYVAGVPPRRPLHDA